MLIKKLSSILLAAAGIALGAGLTSTAQGLLFTTSGTTSGGAVSGSADFAITGSALIITLTNTTGSVGTIAQVLDGLTFTLTNGTAVTLTGVSAAGFEDCHTGTCAVVNTFHDWGNSPPFGGLDVGSPYEWAFTTGSLKAGFGSLQPGGVVNGSITGTDGIPNSQHNDYLLGPVAFNLSGSFTGLTSVSGVTFLWGTTPETTTGGTTLGCTANCVLIQPAPEPGSLALLGLALSGLAWVRRRVRS